MPLTCGDLKIIPGQRTYLMGIVNTTPDSFSDGGLAFTCERALDHALRLLDDGADILDVGGVSTAPDAKFVSEAEELERVLPVITKLAQRNISRICVDTSRAEVARRALLCGASWINDQEAAVHDSKMPEVYAQAQACVLMHRRGCSGVKAGEAYGYDNIIQDINNFFKERMSYLSNWGISRNKIILDPGIGFGKGLSDSMKIINAMSDFNLAACNLLGLSRKSFINSLTDIKEPRDRDFASLGAMAFGVLKGTHILRVHNVKAAFDMTRVLDALITQDNSHENLYKTR